MAGIERNAPCPCGSGIKWKKCHPDMTREDVLLSTPREQKSRVVGSSHSSRRDEQFHRAKMQDDYSRIFRGSPQNFQVHMPDSPLEIIVGDVDSGLKIPGQDLDSLLNCVRWNIPPPFYNRSRSAYVARREPLSLDGNTIRAYKLKGIGVCNELYACPPMERGHITSMGSIGVIIIHMGFGDDGSLIPVADSEKPSGGLSPGRGRKEFENAKRFLQAGVPAVLPIGWGSYKDLMWKGRNIEWVILGCEEESHHRAGEFFETVRKRENQVVALDGIKSLNPLLLEYIDFKFDVYNPNSLGLPAHKCISELCYQNGASLRLAHTSARVFRFASHMGNISYDFRTKRVVRHDMDSSVTPEEIHPNVMGLTICRDLDSALHGISGSYMHCGVAWMSSPEITSSPP